MTEQYFCYTCGKSLSSLTEPHECNPLSREEIIQAAKDFGSKATLSRLSEPGEACGPLSDAAISERAREQRYPNGYATNQQSGEYFAHGYELGVKWVRTELLQARAAHASEVEEIMRKSQELTEGFLKEFKKKDAALASSEARVRILGDALEVYASERYGEEGTLARRALLEVQR